MKLLRRGLFVLPVFLSTPCALAAAPAGLAIEHWTLVTTDTSADGCSRATSPAITVVQDTYVQYCFGVRNVGSVPLVVNDVVTDTFGRLYDMQPLAVQPGETKYLTHVDYASEDRTVNSTWTARDAVPSYTPAPTAFNFVDIRSSGQFLSLYGNLFGADAAAVTLPFDYTVYEVTSPNISICGGGLVSIGSVDTHCVSPFSSVPTSQQPNSIMPWWDFLVPLPGGTPGNLTGVWYQIDGSAPHRRVIVQWQRDREHVDHDGPGDGNGVDFELVLREDDAGFDYQYLDTVFGRPTFTGDNGSGATVAVNYDAALAQAYSVNTPVLSPGLALHWTPNTWRTVHATSSATVLARVPRIDVLGNLSSAQQPNTVVERSATVGNGGTYELDWYAGAAQTNSTAHIPKLARAFPPDWRAPLQPPRTAAATLHGTDAVVPPIAYGRMTDPDDLDDELFVSIDLLTAHVTGISSVYHTTPVGPVQFGDNSRLYALSGGSGLVTVDPVTGVVSPIATVDTAILEDPNLLPTGFAYDVTTGVTYLVANDFSNDDDSHVPPCSGNAWLFRLRTDTGVAHPVGRIAASACVGDIAVNANGEMFGVESIGNTLLAIDKTTGAGTVVGPLGFDSGFFPGNGLDFDLAHNTLYLFAEDNAIYPYGDEVRTVDTATGASTLVATLNGAAGAYAQVTSLAIDNPMGGCVDPAQVPWVSMTPTAGSVPIGAEQTVTVRLDSSGLAPGRYGAVLCVFSNDPTRRFVTLPVQMDVSEEIFANGFEAAAH